MKQKVIIVTGGAGFIGRHLIRRLRVQGHLVMGMDIVFPNQIGGDFINIDLRDDQRTKWAFDVVAEDWGPIDEVYNLACLMGGMGFIGNKKHSYDILVGSTQIVCNVLENCIRRKVGKVFYSSSACVYPMGKQETDKAWLKDSPDDAYPAMPDMPYGWQKLYSEQCIQAAAYTHGLDIRIARFHNIYGQDGIYDGGKEKAPAAICRKVAAAKEGDAIEIWGDGLQTRSFLYIDECLEGVQRLMDSDITYPINIGSEEVISINDLARMVIDISGKSLSIKNVPGNVGVRGRNSNNDWIRQALGWSPNYPLRKGMEILYEWVNKKINHEGSV